MHTEGQAGDLMEANWQALFANLNMRELTGLLVQPERLAEIGEKFRHVNEILDAFILSHTKAALYEGGQRRRLLIGPVNSARDLLEDKQLQARDWFTTSMQAAADGPVVYPGPPYRFSEVPWAIRRPAPLLGEHNVEIYAGELGLTHEQLRILAGAGVI
jgi:crotonobetainyl-CoA:carnitine CoA-transferase CaiB-like acyl-CoA transferase